MLYSLARPLLFKLDAERAHHTTLSAFQTAYRLGLIGNIYKQHKKPVTCMGIKFPNPVGLAAGLDKNGDYIDA
ncbi:MAG: quinone-dependent dihydroorotate dehydrogenase, partial [Acinetobacter sp.]